MLYNRFSTDFPLEQQAAILQNRLDEPFDWIFHRMESDFEVKDSKISRTREVEHSQIDRQLETLEKLIVQGIQSVLIVDGNEMPTAFIDATLCIEDLSVHYLKTIELISQPSKNRLIEQPMFLQCSQKFEAMYTGTLASVQDRFLQRFDLVISSVDFTDRTDRRILTLGTFIRENGYQWIYQSNQFQKNRLAEMNVRMIKSFMLPDRLNDSADSCWRSYRKCVPAKLLQSA